MNYQQLIAQIKSHLENDFPGFRSNETGELFPGLDQIAGFVRQAEYLIYDTVNLPVTRKNVTGSLTAGDKYVGLPDDYEAMLSLAIINQSGEHEYLLNKEESFIRESYPRQAQTGKPKHYAQFDHNSILFGPTPDLDYPVEMHYFYYPASIVDAGTSWLGDHAENVLLYGSLIKGYTHMKGEQDLVTLYNNKYGEALQLLLKLSDVKLRTDTYRAG